MEPKWIGRTGLVVVVLAVMGGTGMVAGCAAERDPIDRTDPGVVDKTFFVGENLEDFHDDPEFRTKSYSIDSATKVAMGPQLCEPGC